MGSGTCRILVRSLGGDLVVEVMAVGSLVVAVARKKMRASVAVGAAAGVAAAACE